MKNKVSKNFKNYMKPRRIEVIKPKIEDKTTNQINFGCSGNDGGPIITHTDKEFAKLSLILAKE